MRIMKLMLERGESDEIKVFALLRAATSATDPNQQIELIPIKFTFMARRGEYGGYGFNAENAMTLTKLATEHIQRIIATGLQQQ